MLKSLQFRVLTAAAAACLLLALANIGLVTANQRLQGQVNERGQYIQQSAQAQGLYQQIVRALADLSVRNQDPKLQAVLARQGLHVTTRPPAPAAADPASPATAPHRGVRHHE